MGNDRPFETERRTWVEYVSADSGKSRSGAIALCLGETLSRVQEIEAIFLRCDDEVGGRAYQVLSVINARDAEVRARVYGQEQVVMDRYPDEEFEFRVVARADRELSEVGDGAGRLVYQKG